MFPRQTLQPKKLLLCLLLAVFLSFALVRPVLAVPVEVTMSLPEEISRFLNKYLGQIGAGLYSGLLDGLSYFMDKMAYDTATWVASGGKGQKPLFLSRARFKQVADEAAGEAIMSLGDNVKFLQKYGINLCVPPEPKFQAWLSLSLAEEWQPSKPRCSFTQVKKAWQKVYEQAGDREYWREVGVGFRPGQSDLSVLMGTTAAIQEISVRRLIESKEEVDLLGKAVPPLTPVSGEAKVPVSIVEKTYEELTPGKAAERTEHEVYSTADFLSVGNYLGVLGNLGRIFTNTLASKLYDRIAKKGFLSVLDVVSYLFPKEGGPAGSPEAQVTTGGRQVAAAAFAEFLKTTPIEEESYDYLGELVVQGILDQNLADALKRPEPLTVDEAIKEGLLDGERKLQSSCPSSSEPNPYCYENLVKLRQWRILPIGWEMAAKLSTTQQYYTLQQARDGFYTVGDPFYHLIDPNWALKAPLARCGAKVYGSTFLVEPAGEEFAGERHEYCADVQNCIKEKEDGTCAENAWGYCLADKNIWRLGADSCDEQFNTCTTYLSTQGKSVSYLANTIDKGICSVDNVGCRAYSTTSSFKNDQWEWYAFTDKNSPIYFDKDVEQCDYSQEGCSGFIRTFGHLIGGENLPDEPLNLKKAPAYYNCYGESLMPQPPLFNVTNNTLSSSTLLWAVNKADLSKIFASWSPAQKEQCGGGETPGRFAQVCSYDEVGCELYSPADGATPIPGILTENDRCPSECVGYESFKQQKTNFEIAPLIDFVYFIPEAATACQSNYAGCDEFINLEAQAAGGEGKEYYTELRACSQNAADGAVYYTWEGSDTAGYQLRSYTLKTLDALFESNANAALAYSDPQFAIWVGTEPAYNTVDLDKLSKYALACNVDTYKNRAEPSFDPDCREFYDKEGNKSYRLYPKTVTVSATECKKLRKSVSNQPDCAYSGGDWDDTQKICVYLAIPAEGETCPANQNGCRTYKGNAGHNFQIIYSESENFESGTVGRPAKDSTGWDGQFSAESTVVGGKSLKVGMTQLAVSQQTFSLPKNTTYLISFWAKGVGPGLEVKFYPSDEVGNLKEDVSNMNTPQPVNLVSEWRNYNVGPFTVTWDEQTVASTTLQFSSPNVFYLDNIVVKRMRENIYIIKDSWRVLSSCDNLFGDAYGGSQGGNYDNPYRLLPQAMLGCQEYNNRAGQPVTVKSFSQMCREEAVGCEEFRDKFNTATEEETFVNVLCELNTTSTSNQSVACKDGKGEERCWVLPNQKGCRFRSSGLGNLISVLGTPYSIFTDLSGGSTKDVENKSYDVTIKKDNQTITIPADRKVYLVNDSKYYCADDNLGCQALGLISYDASGLPTVPSGSVYLKNQPDNYDKILCEKEAEGCEQFNMTQGGVSYFKDPAAGGNDLCEKNTWRRTVNWQPGWAWLIEGTDNRCYTDGTLKRIGDLGYNGKVGLCPADQNGCAEFIDPMDTSPEHEAGTPYFVINNEKLDRASCQNQVSLKEECVLFNETSKGMKTWSASSTYAVSSSTNFAKVNPEDCANPSSDLTALSLGVDCFNSSNDANLILKVKRDRVCGQWLACKSTMTVPDQDRPGAYKNICTELAVCDKANPAEDLLGRCGNWTEETAITPPSEERFTTSTYTSRNISWWDKDYSGYSVPDAYGIADLSVQGQAQGLPLLAGPSNAVVFENKPPVAESCRGYADADAPDKFSDGSDACSFIKVVYSAKGAQSQTKYFPYTKLLGGEGVCDSGWTADFHNKKGEPCLSSANCSDDRTRITTGERIAYPEDGICLLDKKVTRSRGWPGYCLDPSGQSQCNLWYPLSTPSGSVSLDNLFATAGYVPPEGSGKYWCLQAKGNSNRTDSRLAVRYKFTTRRHTNLLVGDDIDFETGKYLDKSIPLLYEEKKLHYSEIAAIEIEPVYEDVVWPNRRMLLFPNQRLAGINNGGGTKKDGYYWSGPLRVSGNFVVLDLVWRRGEESRTEIRFDGLTKSKCIVGLKPDVGDAALGVRFSFDISNGKLVSFRAKSCRIPISANTIKLHFYLTEACTNVSQALKEDENSPMGFSAKARTDKIWEFGGHLLGIVTTEPKFGLPYNQLFTPFGSFNRGSEPVTITLKDYLADKKGDFEKAQAAKVAGYWPIWMAPGGATPLNCVRASGGDCSKNTICLGGPKEGQECESVAHDQKDASGRVIGNSDCNESVRANSCVEVPRASSPDGVGSFDTLCDENSQQPGLECDVDSDCQDRYFCGREVAIGSSDIERFLLNYIPEAQLTAGLCVGGQNHDLPCGSAQDCPPKKYSDAVEEVNETGICVGSSLDPGKAIPTDGLVAAKTRLQEIFVARFGDWVWNPWGYYDYSQLDDKSGGSGSIIPTPPKIYSPYPSTTAPIGYTWGNANSFSIMENNRPSTYNISASKSFPATLRFFAVADNNQMPITRIAVDWGDGSPVYQVKGWFKNRKPYCNEPTLKVCQTTATSPIPDLNRPCLGAGDCKFNESCASANGVDNRLHFGNSSSACQPGYYQFNHLYTCPGKATVEVPVCGGSRTVNCWNGTACLFRPKVQVLDNWGWCNGTCRTVGGTTGCWDDPAFLAITPPRPEKQECSIDNTTGFEDKHWTSFSGTITITP